MEKTTMTDILNVCTATLPEMTWRHPLGSNIICMEVVKEIKHESEPRIEKRAQLPVGVLVDQDI
jgi:ssRNA-specific RNase YbeY (16S rRNA maturation enzyme)